MSMGSKTRIRDAILLSLLVGLASPHALGSEGDGDLLGLMGTLQTLTHKVQLALDAGNQPLAGFYAHELEEVTQALVGIDRYDGFPIGTLTRAMLVPTVEDLEQILADTNGPDPLAAADTVLDRVIAQCNACHAATEHAFIVIERNPINPYAQSFAPR